MLPEEKLSHSTALVEKFLGQYSGVDAILESRQHYDVCRVQLTKNLRESETSEIYVQESVLTLW